MISRILKQNDDDRDEDEDHLPSVKDLLSSQCEGWINLTDDSDNEMCHHIHEIRVLMDADLFRHIERPSVFLSGTHDQISGPHS